MTLPTPVADALHKLGPDLRDRCRKGIAMTIVTQHASLSASGFWNGTDVAFGKPVRWDSERPVETRSIVFPRDDRVKFYELSLGKSPSKGTEKFVRYSGRCLSESNGKAQN